MLLHIPEVMNVEQVARFRDELERAGWVDGRATAGPQSALAKANEQISEGSELARRLGDEVLAALDRSALFLAAALPHRVFPPLFNRYRPGHKFGAHVDNAMRVAVDGARVRTDLSATLFLSAPDSYEGGELVIEDTYGVHSVKLPAGHLILYPASSLHRVEPVASGERMASFFWIQSMIRDDARRTLLFDMDLAIQRLAGEVGHDNAQIVALTGAYHNLLRMWAET